MIILGIDTALRCTGYGVLEVTGKKMQALDCGVIENSRTAPHSQCLARLVVGIEQLIERFSPDIGIIEGGFFAKNAKTSMVLGMARGVVVASLARREIPVYEYAPRRAKQAVVGYGNATKAQVASTLSMLLRLDISRIPPDSTDAISLCVCHALTLGSHQGLFAPDPL